MFAQIFHKKKYILGGWTTNLDAKYPSSFDHIIYGMVTDLKNLKTTAMNEGGSIFGFRSSRSWSPQSTFAPTLRSQKIAAWCYGGYGATPIYSPQNYAECGEIISSCITHGWQGINFYDISNNMDIANIIETINIGIEHSVSYFSYAVYAGGIYTKPTSWLSNKTEENRNTQNKVLRIGLSKNLGKRGVPFYMVLLCYDIKMWTMSIAKKNIIPAIQKTVNMGIEPDRIIIGITYDGLHEDVRDYILNMIIENHLGGLYIWNFGNMRYDDISMIIETLK